MEVIQLRTRQTVGDSPKGVFFDVHLQKQTRRSRYLIVLIFSRFYQPEFLVCNVDKAGDCYEYSFLKATAETEEKGKMILGHLSYILDVVCRSIDKFVQND